LTLSFDNGPDPEATPRVLDVLAAHGLHWIGNHTLTHPRPLGESGVEVCEIETAQAELRELAHPDRLFRPSGAGGDLAPGLLSTAAVESLIAGRFTCVLWNAVPGDWEDEGWVETALDQLAAQDWTLLVLHDVAGACADRLDEFLGRVDAEIVQAFPPACVPIRRGAVRRSLAPYLR
jgi:peptidoglycan/xylan/chitin deacetylase (PgdA/CDA1 family)